MPIYTAWVDEAEAFDPLDHARCDYAVRSLEISGSEGDAPTARVWLEPPPGGWLAPLRPRWTMISHAAAEGAPARLLFRGRLIGAPSDVGGALVELLFDARATDHQQRLTDALLPLKTLPHFDPLYVDVEREDDPTEVLDGWHRVVHVSRLDGAVSTVDALLGARSITLDPTAVEGESVRYRATGTPIPAITVRVEAQWVQRRQGVVDLGARIARENGGPLRTLSASYLFADGWPKPDSTLGGRGWKTRASHLTPHVLPGYDFPVFSVGSVFTVWHFADQAYDPVLELEWTHEQRRVERVELTVTGAAQPLAAAAEAPRTVDLRLRDVAAPLVVGGIAGDPAIGDPARASFFLTPRGHQAVEHAVLVAAVQLAQSQRCIEVTARLPGWGAAALDLDTDARCLIASPRLPGGQAVGKVVSYTLRAASGGVLEAEVRLACSIGISQEVEEVAGTPVYAAGWATAAWQRHAGAVVPVGEDAPAIADFTDQRPDKGLVTLDRLTDEDLVPVLTLHNLGGEHKTILRSPDRPREARVNPQWWVNAREGGLSYLKFCRLDLNPVDDAEHVIAVAVSAPYGRGPGIDLEAP